MINGSAAVYLTQLYDYFQLRLKIIHSELLDKKMRKNQQGASYIGILLGIIAFSFYVENHSCCMAFILG